MSANYERGRETGVIVVLYVGKDRAANNNEDNVMSGTGDINVNNNDNANNTGYQCRGGGTTQRRGGPD
jgi:hypothetical protein